MPSLLPLLYSCCVNVVRASLQTFTVCLSTLGRVSQYPYCAANYLGSYLISYSHFFLTGGGIPNLVQVTILEDDFIPSGRCTIAIAGISSTFEDRLKSKSTYGLWVDFLVQELLRRPYHFSEDDWNSNTSNNDLPS